LKEGAIASVVVCGRANGLFPLIPALSLREREPRRQQLSKFETLRFIARGEIILPLRWGEGWDERERDIGLRKTCGFATVLSVKGAK
jgi:hypothetical protein